VLSCSALKKHYRHILLNGYYADENTCQGDQIPHENYLFVVLHGSSSLLNERMSNRSDHFMPPSLLESQLETLELPGSDEHHVLCSIDKSVNDIVGEIAGFLENSKTMEVNH
jgi:gluconokinase